MESVSNSNKIMDINYDLYEDGNQDCSPQTLQFSNTINLHTTAYATATTVVVEKFLV